MRRWTGDRFVGTLEDGEEPPLLDMIGIEERVVEFERPSKDQLRACGFEDHSPEYRASLAVIAGPEDAEDLL